MFMVLDADYVSSEIASFSEITRSFVCNKLEITDRDVASVAKKINSINDLVWIIWLITYRSSCVI